MVATSRHSWSTKYKTLEVYEEIYFTTMAILNALSNGIWC